MRKGFTLIELLAVVVVIGVIALIVTPIINNVLSKARYKTAEESVYGYVKGLENAVYHSQNSIEITEEKHIFETGEDDTELAKVQVTGTRPTYAYVAYNLGTSKISYGKFCINGYSIEYEYGKTKKSEDNLCDANASNAFNPTFVYHNVPDEISNGYLYSQTIDIIFDGAAATLDYIYATKDLVIANGGAYACDENLVCEDVPATSIAKNTWYRVSEDISVANEEGNDTGSITATIYQEDIQIGIATGTISKIDREKPMLSYTLNGNALTLTMSDAKSGIKYYCLTTTNIDDCNWVNNTESVVNETIADDTVYYAYAKDGAGNISDMETFINVTVQNYDAIPSCSNGGTYDGNGGCVYTANTSICGCAEYNTCENSACGVSSTTYRSCAHSDCGTTTTCGTCKKWKYCYKCGDSYKTSSFTCTSSTVQISCSKSCPGNQTKRYLGDGTCWCDTNATATYGQYEGCGWEYVTDCNRCPNYNTVTNNTCRTAACGVEYESYHTCAAAGCGCKRGATCTKTDSSYLTWSCPYGGTLNGTICER